ncbi:hypothetical protein HOLleu_30741 [Holothuria leucospilota]|uniref:Uncharacterized protein n=1 Tax=Holothuria leucospilota TaxID=206669 RepID=A0A9Q1BL50_HOLLE|nr:hypothetical protein HOLleu_30741 [Holothuria leucospilota]
MMEEEQSLLENEEVNDLGDPQHLSRKCDENPDNTVSAAKLPSTPPPAYSLHSQSVVTYQPVAMPGDVCMKVPWVDDSEIKAIRTKAIISVALSTAFSVCLYPLFFSLPACILGILALCNLRNDTSSAKIYVKVSLGLMTAAVIVILFLFTVTLARVLND